MFRSARQVEDEWLILRCQAGEVEALEALVRRWRRPMLAYAHRLTGRRQAAQDAVQEAWLAIVRGLGRLDDPARFRAWAFRILTNKCADWAHHRHRERRAVENLAATTPRSSNAERDSHDDIAALRAALSELPEQSSAILTLHYLHEFTVAEIAEVFAIPTGTVKSRLHTARRSLREAMDRLETKGAEK